MTGYAARAVPWSLVAVSCATVAGLLALVAASPWVLWPLQGAAAGVLAGAVAWSMDEPSAAVVDTLPRGLRWRTASRSAVVPLLLGVWVVSTVSMRGRIPDHLQLFLLQGLGAVLLGLAVTTWRRARGEAEPGRSFAALVVPLATVLALTRPLAHRAPLFPVWPDDLWVLSAVLWTVLTGASALLLVLALGPADPTGTALSVPRSGGSGRRPRSAVHPSHPSGRR